jgi:hypothetical protein
MNLTELNAVVRFDVGRVMCGQVRTFLESEKFRGRNIQWLESGGWLSHLFTVKGDAQDVIEISRQLEAMDEDDNNSGKA